MTIPWFLIWCREACVLFNQMIFFSPGRVIACISWLHCSATLLMYHHPTSENLDHSWAKCQCFPKLAPPKKTMVIRYLFFLRHWFGLYVLRSSIPPISSYPMPRCWEMVTWNPGHLGLEEFLKFCDALESRVDPVKYDVKQRNLIATS